MINTEIINEALTYLRNYRIREEKEKLMPTYQVIIKETAQKQIKNCQ